MSNLATVRSLTLSPYFRLFGQHTHSKMKVEYPPVELEHLWGGVSCCNTALSILRMSMWIHWCFQILPVCHLIFQEKFFPLVSNNFCLVHMDKNYETALKLNQSVKSGQNKLFNQNLDLVCQKIPCIEFLAPTLKFAFFEKIILKGIIHVGMGGGGNITIGEGQGMLLVTWEAQ